MEVTCGKGGVVHDYVPFYFTSKNPMFLSVLNKKNTDQPFIIYFCMKIDRLDKEDAVYTDSSANTEVPPTFYCDTVNLNKLDWSLIDSMKWGAFSDEERHKKMAEALIYKNVKIEEIDAILVYNNWVADGVRKIFANNGVNPPKILLDGALAGGKYHFYYTKYFLQNREHETLVNGPYFLKKDFNQLVSQIQKDRQDNNFSYRYKDMSSLITAINNNIRVLPELDGIFQMKTSKFHLVDTVDVHIKKVVENIQNTDFYRQSGEEIQNILKLVSYLHDMGKGPISKWNGNIQYNYVDHAYDAMPSLHRILTQEIQEISDDSIRRVCMAVVYHNIAGDCILRDRDKKEMAEVIQDEIDIDILIAITLADVQSLNSTWYMQMKFCSSSLKNEVKNLKGIK